MIAPRGRVIFGGEWGFLVSVCPGAHEDGGVLERRNSSLFGRSSVP